MHLVAREKIEIRMSEYPADSNNLLHGMEDLGVPQCGAGSLLRFSDCRRDLDANVIQAASYEVVSVMPPPPSPKREATKAELYGAATGGPAHHLR